MKSTRRGFLGLLGGGAVAGPSALKGAMADVAVSDVAGAGIRSGDLTCGSASSDGGDWRAAEILRILQGKVGPTTYHAHMDTYPDIEALKSTSLSFRARKIREKNIDAAVAEQVRLFIRERGLNLVGMTEETLLTIIKKAAG